MWHLLCVKVGLPSRVVCGSLVCGCCNHALVAIGCVVFGVLSTECFAWVAVR